MGSGRIVVGDAHRPGRRGGAMSEHDLVSPRWTSSIDESCVGDGQRVGNAGLCCCWLKKMFFCGFSLWWRTMVRNALAVALDWVDLEGKNILGRLVAGGAHCQRESCGGGEGRAHVALPVPDAGRSSPQRKLVLLRWRIDEKEELDTDTPKERLFEESFLSNRTVSFR